jgi:hypothetical protein
VEGQSHSEGFLVDYAVALVHDLVSEHFLWCHETHEFNYRDVELHVIERSFLQVEAPIVLHLFKQEGILLHSYSDALQHVLGRLFLGHLTDVLIHNPELACGIFGRDQKQRAALMMERVFSNQHVNQCLLTLGVVLGFLQVC